MRTSENIADLAQALCKFQDKVKDAHKGTQGHNYRYADLGTILQLVRPLMAEYGLSVVQMPCGDAMTAGLTTRLMHNSGEWIEDTMHMGVSASRGMSEAQAAGSVITYMRRYSLAAVMGITQTDDDAVVEEPEIIPATDEQIASMKEFIEAGKMSPRRTSWVNKNMDRMTTSQATTILSECKEAA